MDDRDEYEPEAEVPVEPVTERVRIIGAQPAGAVAGPAGPEDEGPSSERVPADVPGASHRARDEGPSAPTFDLFGEDTEFDDDVAFVDEPESLPPVGASPAHPEEAGRSAPSGRNGGDPLEPAPHVMRTAEPTAVVPDMPHWTDPPTGQVPAVLDRRTEEDGTEAQWSAAGDTGPAWREHSHEWDDSTFDPSLLADDETRVGALEETPLEERRPWEFDDLTAASADEDTWEAEHDPGPASGAWWTKTTTVRTARAEGTGLGAAAASARRSPRTGPSGAWPRSAPRRCGPSATSPGHRRRARGPGLRRSRDRRRGLGGGHRPQPSRRHRHRGRHRRGGAGCASSSARSRRSCSPPSWRPCRRRSATPRSVGAVAARPRFSDWWRPSPSWSRPMPRALRPCRSSSCSWSSPPWCGIWSASIGDRRWKGWRAPCSASCGWASWARSPRCCWRRASSPTATASPSSWEPSSPPSVRMWARSPSGAGWDAITLRPR